MTETQPDTPALDVLKGVAERATAGEWRHDRADYPGSSWEVCGHDGSDWELFVADCRTGSANAEYIATFNPSLVLALLTRIEGLEGELEEAGEIGERDGYERAVSDIDLLTGGDGEYRFCTNHDPERHTPDPEAMRARIAERLRAADSLARRAILGLARVLGMLEESTQRAAILRTESVYVPAPMAREFIALAKSLQAEDEARAALSGPLSLEDQGAEG